MNTSEVIVDRIYALCKESGISVNRLSTISGMTQSTVSDIANGITRNPGVITIKKLCDGLDITLGEFFSTREFDELEQEIKWNGRWLR